MKKKTIFANNYIIQLSEQDVIIKSTAEERRYFLFL